MISLDDAAVSWPQGNKKLTTRQLHGGSGCLGGAFWGFLIGMIFFVPFLGAAIGAAMGAGSMADVGIRAGVAQAAERSKIHRPNSCELLAMSESIEELRDRGGGRRNPWSPWSISHNVKVRRKSTREWKGQTMCRWLASSGSPILLEELLYKPEHSSSTRASTPAWASRPQTVTASGSAGTARY